MKQTAVEYLIENLIFFYSKNWDAIVDQAKEMEKQQIIDFGNKMQLVKDVDFDGNIEFIFNPKQYYNETFKNK